MTSHIQPGKFKASDLLNVQDKAKEDLGGDLFTPRTPLSSLSLSSLIAVLSVIVISFAIVSLLVHKECEEDKRKGKDKIIIKRNESMALSTVGVGCGMLVFTLLNHLNLSKSFSLVISSFLISTSSLYIHNYRKLDKSECSEKVKRGYNISLVLLGIGIGGLVTSLVSPERTFIMSVLTGVILIFVGSLGIDTRKKCYGKDSDDGKTRKWKAAGGSVAVGILFILIVLGVSFKRYNTKG